ncbi:MAG: hypothetical protein IKE22_03240, partial [Atopobiaceae bacterium]|nr:hypothetical protein [Atopobiaceae bacterium]
MVEKTRRLALVGSVIVAGILSIMLASCAGGQGQSSSAQPLEQVPPQTGGQEVPQAPTDVSGGKPWIDSNIKDNIIPGMQTSPKDDLYLYANYDWLLNTDIPEGDRVVGVGLDTEGREHAAEAVSGEDLKGHDARQAQLLYRAGAPSLIRVVNKNDPSDSTRYAACVQLSPATFGSSMGTMGMDATMVAPEDDLYQARLACASSVLTHCGLSEDEAKDAFKNRVELEKRIVQDAVQDAQEDAVPSESIDSKAEAAEVQRLKPGELDGLAGSFPLRALAEAQGYGAASTFLIDDESQVRAACALFTQENIDLVRDYVLVGYALEASSWLDCQTFEAWRKDYVALGYYDTLAQSNATAEETAFNLARFVLPTPVDRAYAEACDLQRTKEFVEGLCRDAIESHKDIVNASDWLSDTSKKSLCEKLDAITIKAVYPEVWEDYSGLDLDGLSYYEARRAIWLFDIKRNAALTNGMVDERLWRDPSLVGATGAYDGSANSFHVAAGGVEPDVTRYEAGEISLSELMGSSTGYVVFHEIGHALDSIDISVDKDGNVMDRSLLEPDDLKEFERRVQKAKE